MILHQFIRLYEWRKKRLIRRLKVYVLSHLVRQVGIKIELLKRKEKNKCSFQLKVYCSKRAAIAEWGRWLSSRLTEEERVYTGQCSAGTGRKPFNGDALLTSIQMAFFYLKTNQQNYHQLSTHKMHTYTHYSKL